LSVVLREINGGPFTGDTGLSGLDKCSVEQLMGTFFDNHIGYLLFGMEEVKVGPFLDLELEGFSSDILDSDGYRIRASIRQRTHHDHWSVKLALNLDGKPLSLKLFSWNVSELHDGVAFDSWESHVGIEVGLCEVLPFSTVDLECPFGGSVTAAFSAIYFKHMVSSLELNAEI
jgi:hypothetical protein